MEQPVEMNTLSQILEKLRLNGKDNEIKISDHGKMQSANLNKIYTAEDLNIMSDPADNSVVYVVEDKDGDIGYMLDAYGIYSDHDGPVFDDFLKKINVADRNEQEIFK